MRRATIIKTDSVDRVALFNAGTMGFGLMAMTGFAIGELILECPYIVFGPKGAPLAGNELAHYVFAYPFKRDGTPSRRTALSATVFGLASMINHSDNENCTWRWKARLRMHQTVASRAIKAGEQLFFNYGWPKSEWDN
jgi:hypothetical protein